MSNDKIIRAAATAIPIHDLQSGRISTWDAAKAVVAAVEPLIIAGALPDGAKWFPAEGGIMWQGKTYYPADYILTRKDIALIRAQTLRDAADKIRTSPDAKTCRMKGTCHDADALLLEYLADAEGAWSEVEPPLNVQGGRPGSEAAG